MVPNLLLNVDLVHKHGLLQLYAAQMGDIAKIIHALIDIEVSSDGYVLG